MEESSQEPTPMQSMLDLLTPRSSHSKDCPLKPEPVSAHSCSKRDGAYKQLL